MRCGNFLSARSPPYPQDSKPFLQTRDRKCTCVHGLHAAGHLLAAFTEATLLLRTCSLQGLPLAIGISARCPTDAPGAGTRGRPGRPAATRAVRSSAAAGNCCCGRSGLPLAQAAGDKGHGCVIGQQPLDPHFNDAVATEGGEAYVSRSVPSSAGHRFSKSPSRWSPRSNRAWIRCCASLHVRAV